MKLLAKIWHAVRWPLLVLVVAYFALVLYRIPAVGEQQKTTEAIASINSRKITLSDVQGTNLPPQPYKPENDATVAGLDKNGNGIRDDVELAIHAKYPNSAKIRAAELQYALADQIQLTEVFNKDTWIVSAKQESRSFACVGETIVPKNVNLLNAKIKEVDNLVFNTEKRNQAKAKSDSFTTSYGLPNTDFCDIDLSSLSN